MIRSAIKESLGRLLGRPAAPPPAPRAPLKAVWREPPPAGGPPVEVDAAPPAAEPVVEAAPAVEVAPAHEPPAAPAVEAAHEAPAAPADAPVDDTAGPALSLAAVQEIMDEMVRPALQGDGGDITLIKVQDNDVYVKLVGSCSTCPSSIMTMKMGVEALLKEEFPVMRSLIQVD